MLWKNTQHSWKGGQFDRALMGRSDLTKYPEAASKLENFIVKRQGCISKRRGTEEVADLTNLLGGEVKPIGMKLIPLVYEKDEGYYVIMTRGRAFVAGRDGIRLMDGSWTKDIAPYELTDYNPDGKADAEGYTGTKPFSIRKFGYDTLQKAIDSALKGDVIRVQQDDVVTGAATVSTSIRLTIDLNGHRILSSSTGSLLTLNHASASVTLLNSGPETFYDPDGNEVAVDFRHNAARDKALVTVTKGTFILGKGGRLYGTGTGSASYGVAVASGGTFQMNGGAIEAEKRGVSVSSGGTCQIDAGEITSRTGYVVYGGNGSGHIVVNEGRFSGKYGFYSYTDVYGGIWTVTGRVGYSNDTIHGGRWKLSVADFYNTKFPVYRGEFYTAVESAELAGALAQGGAIANDFYDPYVDEDGNSYAGWHQSNEFDYKYVEPEGEGGSSIGIAGEDNTKKPFYVNVPYDDGDLAELDYTQSGDVIFLAHRKYPFATLTFVGQGLEYEVRSFTGETWKRPSVTKVGAASGSSFPTSGAYKTVHYCCTYVKDGVESLPSQPYAFKYRLPWPQTAAVEITVSKGGNDTEPDYYNIYKKESTEFGLIGSIGMNLGVRARPVVDSTGSDTTLVRQGRAWGPARGQEMEINPSNAEWYLNREDKHLVLGTFLNGSEGWGYQGIGGVCNQGSLIFDFGSDSGVVISNMKLALDAHEFVTEDSDYAVPSEDGVAHRTNKRYVNYFSGRHFKVVLKTMNSSGTVKSFTKQADVGALPFYTVSGSAGGYSVGETALVAGKNSTWFPTQFGITDAATGTRHRHGVAEVDEYIRFLEVDFTDELKETYPNTTGDTGGKEKTNFSVSSITVTAYIDTAASKSCKVYWHGVTFSSAYGSSHVYEDEYITPDMSITPPSNEDHFSTSGDYPGCAAIYQQRLCLAASEREPNGFWMSCTGDLFNFDVHSSIREDDAISAQIAATEFPQINHMVMSKDLMLFCDASEWEVAPSSGNSLSYKTVSAKIQSTIGCIKTLKPFTVGDEIIFVEATGQTLRSIRYNFVSDGYESTDLSVLSQDLTRNNPIVQMAYQQCPDSLVWCVLEDGTLATLVYMKEHEMVAWSHHTLGGGFAARGIASSKALYHGTTDVAILVERDGDWRLWRVKDDDATPLAEIQVAMDGMRYWDSCREHDLPLPDQTCVSCGYDIEAYGYPIVAELVTMRPESDPRETLRYEIKNPTEVELAVLDASTFRVRAFGQDPKYDREIPLDPTLVPEGRRLTLSTGDVRKTLYGNNCRDGRIALTHDGVWPFTLLTMSTTYQVELANATAKEARDEN